ncbi:hypothetical protein [Anaerosinus sp.]
MTAVTAIAKSFTDVDKDIVSDMINLIEDNPSRYGGKFAEVILKGLKLTILNLNQELHTASISRAEEIRRDLLQIKLNMK